MDQRILTRNCALCSCITWWRKCDVQNPHFHWFRLILLQPPIYYSSKQGCIKTMFLQLQHPVQQKPLGVWASLQGKAVELQALNAEFSSVMICVFYAMFSEKKNVEGGTRNEIPARHSNIPLIGLFCGFLFFIFSIAFCLFDEDLGQHLQLLLPASGRFSLFAYYLERK